jgi:hypothetical protein
MVAVLQEVVVMGPQRLKPKTICHKTSRVVDRAYLESVVPFMVSCPPPLTPNPPSSRKSLPYPIYTAWMIPNALVWVFRKAIHVNREKNEVDIINLFFVTLCNAISKWGENFMRTHQVCKFEELEAAFRKCYKIIQMDEQVYMAL